MTDKEEIKEMPAKPLVLLKKECFDALARTINESGLPAFIIEPMLRDLLGEAQAAMRTEYESTLQWYNKQCEMIGDVSKEPAKK